MKYLITNVSQNRIIVVATIVDTTEEVKEAIKQILDLAKEKDFDIDDFFQEGSAGAYAELNNGTMLQYLYLSQ
jgi:hypothetical protein